MQARALQRYYSFESYWEFEVFDTALTQQLATGQLVATSAPQIMSTLAPYQPDAWYQLPATQEIWVLSIPDNAWRGYFLPLADATAYQQMLLRQDQRGKVGCWLLLLVVGAILIWQSILLFLDGLPTVSP